eukprot:m.307721 g.307721  ORF g.307721 m.307721 type:complete len:294 (+) comp42709_c0_seq1:151-1032(+)
MTTQAVNVHYTGTSDKGWSRQELLAWVNDSLQLNCAKVEEMGNGAAYCQFMHMLFPEARFQLKKVKMDAKLDHQYIDNFKFLQSTFKKVGVTKVVPIDRLIKKKPLDNLEFLQWFKKFFDANYQGGDYNPSVARSGEAPGSPARHPVSGGGGATKRKAGLAKKAGPSGLSGLPSRIATTTTVTSSHGTSSRSGDAQKLAAQLEEMKLQYEQLQEETKVTVDGLEKERDFYFQKLRDIEELCQKSGEIVPMADLQGLLYATEDGFEAPPEGQEETTVLAANGDYEEEEEEQEEY